MSLNNNKFVLLFNLSSLYCAHTQGCTLRKIGWGVCGLLPKTLNLYMTGICDVLLYFMT